MLYLWHVGLAKPQQQVHGWALGANMEAVRAVMGVHALLGYRVRPHPLACRVSVVRACDEWYVLVHARVRYGECTPLWWYAWVTVVSTGSGGTLESSLPSASGTSSSSGWYVREYANHGPCVPSALGLSPHRHLERTCSGQVLVVGARVTRGCV